ncbi:response regulator [Occallatibacter savannae]|uniref:response regulator n=1 Tax=Occallatibacter savannae TaxID=1002691 RepID=UPI000D6940AE|nr:response regulator [Occallatibacter savannae]
MPDCKVKSALVLENDPKDILVALSILRSVGISDVCSFASSLKAQNFLYDALNREAPLPDLLVVDLDLQQESGYEFIRHWRTVAGLRDIPLIVWSKLGQDHEQVCEVFHVSCFIPKWKGREALESAIREECFA